MEISGIYRIQSIIKPERIYIGSAVDIKGRWRGHFYDLRKNKHGSTKLQNHCNKYGECDLQFSILLGCNKEDLIKHEQFFIDSLNPYFNSCKKAGSNLGLRWSEETKKKQSDAKRGKVVSEETKRKMSESARGRIISDLTKLRIKKSWEIRKLTPMSEETRRKISESHKGQQTWLGRHHSIETIKKYSEMRKGKKRGHYKKANGTNS
jgi:group I intron endonuclease